MAKVPKLPESVSYFQDNMSCTGFMKIKAMHVKNLAVFLALQRWSSINVAFVMKEVVMWF